MKLKIDSEISLYRLEDDKGNLIRQWEYGDDICRVLKDIFQAQNITLTTEKFTYPG